MKVRIKTYEIDSYEKIYTGDRELEFDESSSSGHVFLTMEGSLQTLSVMVSLDELNTAVQAFNHLRGRQC